MASKRTVIKQRRDAVADALASVRAEGLEPSKSAKKLVEQYVKGEITADQMYRQTLDDIRNGKD